jgi:hypothetical protein
LDLSVFALRQNSSGTIDEPGSQAVFLSASDALHGHTPQLHKAGGDYVEGFHHCTQRTARRRHDRCGRDAVRALQLSGQCSDGLRRLPYASRTGWPQHGAAHCPRVNITPDRDTGIGAWTKDDIKRLLSLGARPDGALVALQMSYGFYKILTPGDLDAIAVYLKTIKPVSNEMPSPVYKAAAYPVPLPGAETSIGDTVPADPVKRGFYLATLAHCMEGHSRKPDGVQDSRTGGARAVTR